MAEHESHYHQLRKAASDNIDMADVISIEEGDLILWTPNGVRIRLGTPPTRIENGEWITQVRACLKEWFNLAVPTPVVCDNNCGKVNPSFVIEGVGRFCDKFCADAYQLR